MTVLKEEIREIAARVYPKVIEYRQHLHSNPELSFKEYQTSAFVKGRLTEIGIEWKSVTETGIVGIIKGDKPSDKVIALRADMDALPITEQNEVAYASKNIGVMHACGHDCHTASLLGVATILQTLKSKFGGTIKLIFQPGEEILPGGASLMIKEGALADPVPMAVIGQHVMPALEAGQVGVRSGKFMASMDELFVTVRGKGGHGAQPHLNIDPVLIASHIIVALQQVVSRTANPFAPTVLSFGKVIANGAINVIPDEVYMEGTFRAMDETWRARAHDKMKKVATGIAESMGGTCDFTIVKGYPHLINDEEITRKVKVCLREYLGHDKIKDIEPWMASEDFAYYSQVTNSCYYLLGVGNKSRGIVSSLHTPTFNIDETSLIEAPGLMAYIALTLLEN
ncbi:MAG TPA: M20 family metallopeptidase [Agriterribacter sp.]|nr:M20 family metallopeptidase [Agriterribacter sp.]